MISPKFLKKSLGVDFIGSLSSQKSLLTHRYHLLQENQLKFLGHQVIYLAQKSETYTICFTFSEKLVLKKFLWSSRNQFLKYQWKL